MDFSDSPLQAETDAILTSPVSAGNYRWEMRFKLLPNSPVDLTDPTLTTLQEEQDGYFTPFKIHNIDILSDYEKAAGDHVNTVVTVTAGMWLKVLLPGRKFMRATLTRYTLLGINKDVDDSVDPQVFEFKVIFKLQPDGSEAGNAVAVSREELDRRGFVQLDIDLLDPVMEIARTADVGGIWRDCTAKEVIQAIYARESEKMVVDGQKKIEKILFAENSNEKKRDHILLEQGTGLLNVPGYLQSFAGGVWPTGINRYLQNNIWYFYPPYDTTRFDKVQKTLTVIRVPEAYYQSPETTYLLDGTRLKVLATSKTRFMDDTQTRYLNEGDGVRFGDANSVMGNWVQTDKNKATAQRGKKNTETRIEDKSNIDHVTTMADTGINANPLAVYSALAARRGQMVSFVWENADHTLLYPGMPVKIFYLKGETVAELLGVLVFSQMSIQLFGQGPATDTHRGQCSLSVFCNISPENETP